MRHGVARPAHHRTLGSRRESEHGRRRFLPGRGRLLYTLGEKPRSRRARRLCKRRVECPRGASRTLPAASSAEMLAPGMPKLASSSAKSRCECSRSGRECVGSGCDRCERRRRPSRDSRRARPRPRPRAGRAGSEPIEVGAGALVAAVAGGPVVARAPGTASAPRNSRAP